MTDADPVVVQSLELEQFRVYESLRLDIPPAGLRVVGANGTGKSSLLEAIELVSTTRPRRGANDGDLIAHGSGVDLGVPPYTRVDARVLRGDASVEIEVFVQKREHRSGTKKVLKVADRSRRASDVVGLVPTVSFAPDDLDLVLGSPSVRRRFLDVMLSQTDRRYLGHLSRYARILAQRNGLLKDPAAAGASTDDQFSYWDEQLVALGAYIIAARARVVGALNAHATRRFNELSPASSALGIGYASTLSATESWWSGLVSPGSDILDAAQRVGAVFESQLRRSRPADLARGATSVGPHRDDLDLSVDGRPLSRFGSRGQQRLAVLALKLAELAHAEAAIGLHPVLLLDDILSELDPAHREALLAAVVGSGQTFITATEAALVDRAELGSLEQVWLREPGRLAPRQ